MNEKITNHHSVIPALPGYYVLETFFGESDRLELAKIPIVAWVITYDYWGKEEDIKFPHAQPVTYEGASHGSHGRRVAILSPDGTVDEPFCCTWETADRYLESVRNTNERKQNPESFD
jgi:hypothetical protein